jgi:hypothetical protein
LKIAKNDAIFKSTLGFYSGTTYNLTAAFSFASGVFTLSLPPTVRCTDKFDACPILPIYDMVTLT